MVCISLRSLGASPSFTIQDPVHLGLFSYIENLDFKVTVDSDPAADPADKPMGTLRIWACETGPGAELWYDTTNMTYGEYTQTAIPYCYWPIGSASLGETFTVNGTALPNFVSIGFYDP